MDFWPDKDLVDDLCREDRVRDLFQPRLHDSPKDTEFNNLECKEIRFGGKRFVAFNYHLQEIDTWVHEFTEHAVHYVIEMFIFNTKLNSKWRGFGFYRFRYGFSATPWHILSSLVTYACDRGGRVLLPNRYWKHLKSSRVQTRITEFLD